jgi:hypothetical protein
MRSLSWWISVLVAPVIALSWAAPAEACSRIALSGIRGFQTLPADGSRVPRSTAVWIRSDLPAGDTTSTTTVRDASAVKLLDQQGRAVALSPTSVRVSGEQPATLFVLRPTALLEANTTYRIEHDGVVLSRFSTSEEVDQQPPPLPVAKVAQVEGERASAYGCGGPSAVTVSLSSPGDVNFLVSSDERGSTMPGVALAVTGGATDLTAVAVPEGTVDLRVVTFDLSGNMTMAPEKLVTFVPGESAGCMAAPSGLLLGAVALLGLRRRRLVR